MTQHGVVDTFGGVCLSPLRNLSSPVEAYGVCSLTPGWFDTPPTYSMGSLLVALCLPCGAAERATTTPHSALTPTTCSGRDWTARDLGCSHAATGILRFLELAVLCASTLALYPHRRGHIAATHCHDCVVGRGFAYSFLCFDFCARLLRRLFIEEKLAAACSFTQDLVAGVRSSICRLICAFL